MPLVHTAEWKKVILTTALIQRDKFVRTEVTPMQRYAYPTTDQRKFQKRENAEVVS